MQGGMYGGTVIRGPSMYGNSQYSTVAMGNVYGPAAGQAVSDRASSATVSAMGRTIPGMGVLTVPLVLAAGVLIWFALKSYD